jgi:assimilatory nitrate reductase catalytic subunit
LQAVVLAGDTRAEAWIRDPVQQVAAQSFGRRLLRSDGQAPVALQPADRRARTGLDVAAGAA